jgi:hypothetical protein
VSFDQWGVALAALQDAPTLRDHDRGACCLRKWWAKEDTEADKPSTRTEVNFRGETGAPLVVTFCVRRKAEYPDLAFALRDEVEKREEEANEAQKQLQQADVHVEGKQEVRKDRYAVCDAGDACLTVAQYKTKPQPLFQSKDRWVCDDCLADSVQVEEKDVGKKRKRDAVVEFDWCVRVQFAYVQLYRHH